MRPTIPVCALCVGVLVLCSTFPDVSAVESCDAITDLVDQYDDCGEGVRIFLFRGNMAREHVTLLELTMTTADFRRIRTINDSTACGG